MDVSALFVAERALLLIYMNADNELENGTAWDVDDSSRYRADALRRLNRRGIYPFYDEIAQAYCYRVERGKDWIDDYVF